MSSPNKTSVSLELPILLTGKSFFYKAITNFCLNSNIYWTENVSDMDSLGKKNRIKKTQV